MNSMPSKSLPLKHFAVFLSVFSTVVLCAPASAQSADVVYGNGRIYTVNDGLDWAQAMAIREGKFIRVGSMDEMRSVMTPATKVVDLKGRMVIPGIQDLHAHPVDAGQRELLQCGFPIGDTIDEIVKKLARCARETPPGQWVRGGMWPAEVLQPTVVPHRELLDQASLIHPIYIRTARGVLLNSKGLEALAISRDSTAPENGVIEKDEFGIPTGVLKGRAAQDAQHRIPPFSEEQNLQALRWSIAQMNKVGVTSVKDALAHDYSLKAYSALADAGQLTMRVTSSLAWKYAGTKATESERQAIAQRAVYQRDRHDPNFIKIVLDGIPPTRTAAMLDPYLPDQEHGDNYRGKLKHSVKQLQEDLIALDAQGLTVKIHATGDRALRESLDAFEAARHANGNSGLIHEVAHAEFIHPDDIPRFSELNVAAEMSPVIWYPSPLSIAAGKAVGEQRGKRIFPIKSLLEAGALVIYGSDWPSVAPDPSPWPGMEAMITRRNPSNNTGEQFWPEQAINLPQVIQIYTRNGAVAMKQEAQSGSFEVGKYADFIVLDRNLFDVPVTELSEVKVLLTVLEGKVVHEL